MSNDVVALLVNGERVFTDRAFPVVDPATEETIAQVANADTTVSSSRTSRRPGGTRVRKSSVPAGGSVNSVPRT